MVAENRRGDQETGGDLILRFEKGDWTEIPCETVQVVSPVKDILFLIPCHVKRQPVLSAFTAQPKFPASAAQRTGPATAGRVNLRAASPPRRERRRKPPAPFDRGESERSLRSRLCSRNRILPASNAPASRP